MSELSLFDLNLSIENGFEITKNYATTKQAWDQLVSNEILYKSLERQGQCHENIVKADLHCFSILHFKLRSLDFAQKILYRLFCGQKDWRDESMSLPLYMLRILKNAKKECIDAIKERTGMLIDSPGGSCGGNYWYFLHKNLQVNRSTYQFVL